MSVAQLTEAIGVAPASLYAAFGSKAELYKETLDLYLRRVSVQATYTLETDQPIHETVSEMLKSAVYVVTDADGVPGCMVSMSMLLAAPEHAALAQHTQNLRQQWQERIAARLQRAIMAGELPSKLSAELLACYLVSLMQGIGIQARDGASREALMDVARLGYTTLFGSDDSIRDTGFVTLSS
ncbi:TetR/AcrR family transcriptional regulator [Gallaecimonas mangrovi]|uniref:TetR/AcrR family transcriptional regulator n=1 Tax=Gallaecimonas mangrovi TaxID=2291597 RepID=UPI0021F6B760|nr:TetR/AcrR family transcriptional regulator [Gallaecimonas mangrovi]